MATINRKGVLDIDTVKGCSIGMKRYPDGGCYGLCYAAKTAKFYGYDFSSSVSRKIDLSDSIQETFFNMPGYDGPKSVVHAVKNHALGWFRIGTMGDPCHDWVITVDVCEWLGGIRTPIIVTKHWIKIPDDLLARLGAVGAIFNNSISALDTEQEINHRLRQHQRFLDAGIKSYLRVVTCKFGETEQGKKWHAIQLDLISNYGPIIDNPLRIPANDRRVVDGHIVVCKRQDMAAKVSVSINDENVYLGHCKNCPDQCGLTINGGK